MADTACKEEYTYQIGKITFIVTPVYKDEGEPMRDRASLIDPSTSLTWAVGRGTIYIG